ncbi:MAG: O-antigen ligase family protein [Clostridium sp.]
MTVIIQAVKESFKLDFLKNLQLVYEDFDRFLVLLLAASIFAPFYISVIIVSGIALMTIVNCKKRVRAFEAPYTKFLFGFLIATFFIAAIYDNYIGMVYSILIYVVVTCALYIRSVMTRSMFNQAMDLICIGSIFSLFVALYQKASTFASMPGYRPVSVFANANYYGMVIEFVVLIALYRIFTNPELSAFYFAVIGLNFIGLYLTASFSSFMALFVAVTLMLFLKRQKKIALIVMVSVALLVILLSVFPQLLPRGSQAIDHTIAQRFSIWTASVKGIEHHLFFGRGAMAYQMIYEQFSGYKTYHCHNLILDILLNFGIVGFIAIGIYVGVQARIVQLRIRNNICMNMNYLLIAASTAVFVHGLTDVTILWIQTGMLFALIYASTGIGSSYIEKSIRLPSLFSEYAADSAAVLSLEN